MSRKKNESIIVNHDIVITVVEIRGDKVRLGVVAPKDVSVHRQEVHDAILGAMAIQSEGLRPSQLLPPVMLDPHWCTATVVALARGMSKSRDFSALPILADALQDAGCDNDDILNHCRNAGTAHVRGSWVIDLILAGS